MKTTWGILDPPVGNTRLNVIRLISSLLQTNTSSINGDLMELNSIGVILVRPPPRGTFSFTPDVLWMRNVGYSLTDLQCVSMTFLGLSVNGFFYSFCLEFITNFECF